MARNRASAKAAGSRFERQIADILNRLIDDRIDRRVKTGARDRGDISGWRYAGLRIVAELKNTTRTELGAWANEAETQRLNDDADVGLIVHKRHGKGDPLDQWVTMPLRELITLLTHERPGENQ